MGELTEPRATCRADGSWLLNGLLPIAEFEELLGIGDLADEGRIHYQTVGGFVITRIGDVPTVGQCFEWRGLRFEVVDMDGHRVDKLLVSPRPTEETECVKA